MLGKTIKIASSTYLLIYSSVRNLLVDSSYNVVHLDFSSGINNVMKSIYIINTGGFLVPLKVFLHCHLKKGIHSLFVFFSNNGFFKFNHWTENILFHNTLQYWECTNEYQLSQLSLNYSNWHSLHLSIYL